MTIHAGVTSRCRRRCGFSLLELLAVLTILGIIAVVVIPRLALSPGAAKANADAQNKAEINAAVKRWHSEKGCWPAQDLSDIATDPDFLPLGLPVNPVTGQAYRLDETTHRVP